MPLTTDYKKNKLNQSSSRNVYVYGVGDSWVAVKLDTNEKSSKYAYDPDSLQDSRRAYKWAETHFNSNKG